MTLVISYFCTTNQHNFKAPMDKKNMVMFRLYKPPDQSNPHFFPPEVANVMGRDPRGWRVVSHLLISLI